MPFCPRCGSKIGDDEVFCKKCESSLKKVGVRERKPARVEPAAKSRISKTLILAVGALFLIGILLIPVNTQETYEVTETYIVKQPVTAVETYYEKEPYTITEPKSSMLPIEDKYVVPAREYKEVFAHIDPEGKTQNIITGEISETTGNDINFYIFDRKNFNAWKEGKENKPYVSKERTKKFEFSFVPDHADDYIFVMDNRYSWLTPKVANINAQWSWKEVKTGYKDVEKKRIVTSYQDVEKKKVVQKTKTVRKKIYEIVLEKFSS
ncbi:MAG: hypothetical protein QME68_05730 [Elusimicrobiota bacterium]|nr:hypothetical protein [Elusimicrobiota bacterium]